MHDTRLSTRLCAVAKTTGSPCKADVLGPGLMSVHPGLTPALAVLKGCKGPEQKGGV